MATQIVDPYHCTFIHIPKTGGNSITNWMQTHFKAFVTKRDQHATVNDAKQKWNDLGWTFCVVRNPWDYAVSWYTFKIDLAQVRIEMAQTNDKYKNSHKKKFDIDVQNSEIQRLESLGFEGWLRKTRRDQQIKWADDCDYVIKLENLEEDFKEVQKRLNCFEPLGHLNKTRNRKNYQDYYVNQELIDIVADKWKDDIQRFNYQF